MNFNGDLLDRRITGTLNVRNFYTSNVLILFIMCLGYAYLIYHSRRIFDRKPFVSQKNAAVSWNILRKVSQRMISQNFNPFLSLLHRLFFYRFPDFYQTRTDSRKSYDHRENFILFVRFEENEGRWKK